MMKAQVDIKMKSFLVITTMTKIIGETPEVLSDKRKKEKKEEKERKEKSLKKKREIERKREKGEKKREKDVQGQTLSICIQFSKRKTKYIGRNAQNLKK